MKHTLTFLLNGTPIQVEGVSPTTTLLQWLREHQRLTGTKEGCAEGDCGACTVVVGSLNHETLELSAINACLRFLPTLQGKAIFTVEYLRGAQSELHPVQQAMVDHHAAQCGFCTPGFVMSLWRVYVEATAAQQTSVSEPLIRDALSGNLCRCTGYRPIIEAGKTMLNYPTTTFHRTGITQALQALRDAAPPSDHFVYVNRQAPQQRFDAPKTINRWLQLKAEHPEALVLAGSTDVGLWSTKQLRPLPHLLYIGDIAETQNMEERDDTLIIGTGVSLERAYQKICDYFPQLNELWWRFASTPIRHAGTLGGNLANGSPIGDSMPALIVLNASIELGGWQDGTVVKRRLPLEDFYLAYQKKAWAAHEVLLSIHLPIGAAAAPTHFASYKVAKRYDSDISAVCGAYAINVVDGTIRSARIAYGGMAATSKRAAATEAALLGQVWDESTLTSALNTLPQDYQPLSDMRASADYRMQVAQNLLRRFYEATQNPTQPMSVFANMNEVAA